MNNCFIVALLYVHVFFLANAYYVPRGVNGDINSPKAATEAAPRRFLEAGKVADGAGLGELRHQEEPRRPLARVPSSFLASETSSFTGAGQVNRAPGIFPVLYDEDDQGDGGREAELRDMQGLSKDKMPKSDLVSPKQDIRPSAGEKQQAQLFSGLELEEQKIKKEDMLTALVRAGRLTEEDAMGMRQSGEDNIKELRALFPDADVSQGVAPTAGGATPASSRAAAVTSPAAHATGPLPTTPASGTAFLGMAATAIPPTASVPNVPAAVGTAAFVPAAPVASQSLVAAAAAAAPPTTEGAFAPTSAIEAAQSAQRGGIEAAGRADEGVPIANKKQISITGKAIPMDAHPHPALASANGQPKVATTRSGAISFGFARHSRISSVASPQAEPALTQEVASISADHETTATLGATSQTAAVQRLSNVRGDAVAEIAHKATAAHVAELISDLAARAQEAARAALAAAGAYASPEMAKTLAAPAASAEPPVFAAAAAVQAPDAAGTAPAASAAPPVSAAAAAEQAPSTAGASPPVALAKVVIAAQDAARKASADPPKVVAPAAAAATVSQEKASAAPVVAPASASTSQDKAEPMSSPTDGSLHKRERPWAWPAPKPLPEADIRQQLRSLDMGVVGESEPMLVEASPPPLAPAPRSSNASPSDGAQIAQERSLEAVPMHYRKNEHQKIITRTNLKHVEDTVPDQRDQLMLKLKSHISPLVYEALARRHEGSSLLDTGTPTQLSCPNRAPKVPDDKAVETSVNTCNVSEIDASDPASAVRLRKYRGMAEILNLRLGSKVLDWGSGCGIEVNRIAAEKDFSALGLDQAEDSVNWANKQLNYARFCFGDGSQVASLFGENTFDAVISNNAFGQLHTRDAQIHGLHEILKVLRPGGCAWLGFLGVSGDQMKQDTWNIDRMKFPHAVLATIDEKDFWDKTEDDSNSFALIACKK